MVFTYHCTDKEGKFYEGVIHQDSLEGARQDLETRGWSVLRLEASTRPSRGQPVRISRATGAAATKPAGRRAPGRSDEAPAKGDAGGVRLSRVNLRLFTVQLAVMLNASIPILRALEAVGESGLPELRETAGLLSSQLLQGHSLSQAMRRLPRAFDSAYVALVQAGERSGKLARSLTALAQRLDAEIGLLHRIRQALTYPAAVTVTSVAMLSFLLYYMFPRFAEVFSHTGLELPLLTRLVMALSSNFLVPLTLAALLVETVLVLLQDPEDGRGARMRSYLQFETPVIGTIGRKVSLAQTCQHLAMLLHAGVPAGDALRLVAEQPRQDLRLTAALHRVCDDVVSGASLAGAVGEQPVFPSLLRTAVEVGTSTGQLGEWLERVAQTLEAEVDVAVDVATELIEPLTLGLTGAAVAVVVMAAFLPIYTMVTANLA